MAHVPLPSLNIDGGSHKLLWIVGNLHCIVGWRNRWELPKFSQAHCYRGLPVGLCKETVKESITNQKWEMATNFSDWTNEVLSKI